MMPMGQLGFYLLAGVLCRMFRIPAVARFRVAYVTAILKATGAQAALTQDTQ